MQMSMTSTMAHHENSCSLFLISYDLFCPLSFWRPTISGPQVKATTSRKPRGKLPQGSTKVMATCCRFWMILAHFHHSHPSGFGSGCSNDLLLSRPYSQYLRGGSVLGPPIPDSLYLQFLSMSRLSRLSRLSQLSKLVSAFGSFSPAHC